MMEQDAVAIRTDLGAIFVSLELSRSTWLVTSLSPGNGERMSKHRRRAKTDKLDGDTLVRTLLAFKRGEPRVCAMVRVPTPEEVPRAESFIDRAYTA